jgi:peptide/nickel transport system permease protein
MLQYIVRRVLWVIVLLFVVSALTFIIFFVLPSADPAQLRAGRQPNPQLVEQIRHNLGLDRPKIVQYGDYMKQVFLHFDFGYSYQNTISVKEQIFQRLPATISLAIGAAVVWLTVGITVGIISAVRSRSLLDRVAMGGALVAISAPVYWLGLLVLYLFSNDIGKWKLLPGAGSYVPFSQDPWKWFTSLIMPWCVLAAAFAAFYARLLRSNLIETMGEDYIRTGRAKGLSEKRVVLRHGLRSAITPIVTAAGLDIGILLGGAILTETVFNIPGIGRLVFESIQHSDLPMIQGTVLLGTFFIVTANLVVDIIYAFLDPRVRYA